MHSEIIVLDKNDKYSCFRAGPFRCKFAAMQLKAMNNNCDIVDAKIVLPRKVVTGSIEVRDGLIRRIGKKAAARRRPVGPP